MILLEGSGLPVLEVNEWFKEAIAEEGYLVRENFESLGDSRDLMGVGKKVYCWSIESEILVPNC